MHMDTNGNALFFVYHVRAYGGILYISAVLQMLNLDDFRRRCGLASNDTFTMHVFPNHIESLFSL
ncbi:hypothetical protein DY000_02008844 [Brassica cretica]|uniref:Uncharacterized protein n=1 Tax=Brassica cretica TaxID=69181 RepID=A0ABQ7BTU6_BRACR|nr:hypothetical protein DY000_02008844 [Brassica cretica]